MILLSTEKRGKKTFFSLQESQVCEKFEFRFRPRRNGHTRHLFSPSSSSRDAADWLHDGGEGEERRGDVCLFHKGGHSSFLSLFFMKTLFTPTHFLKNKEVSFAHFHPRFDKETPRLSEKVTEKRRNWKIPKKA